MPVNFDDIGSITLENVKRPPLAPLGTYVFQVMKVGEWGDVESDKGSWKSLRLACRGIRPTEDVDMAAFQDFGEAKNILVNKDFMITKDPNDKAGQEQGLYNIKRFLVEHLQLPEVDPNGAAIPLKLLLNNSVGKQFLGVLRYRSDSRDPETKYHDLGATAPLQV